MSNYLEKKSNWLIDLFILKTTVRQNEEQSEKSILRCTLMFKSSKQFKRLQKLLTKHQRLKTEVEIWFTDVCFQKQRGITQQCGGSCTDESVNGGGLNMKCVRWRSRGFRCTVSGEYEKKKKKEWGKMSGYQTERRRGGGRGGWKSVVLQQQYAELE